MKHLTIEQLTRLWCYFGIYRHPAAMAIAKRISREIMFRNLATIDKSLRLFVELTQRPDQGNGDRLDAMQYTFATLGIPKPIEPRRHSLPPFSLSISRDECDRQIQTGGVYIGFDVAVCDICDKPLLEGDHTHSDAITTATGG